MKQQIYKHMPDFRIPSYKRLFSASREWRPRTGRLGSQWTDWSALHEQAVVPPRTELVEAATSLRLTVAAHLRLAKMGYY